MDSIAGESSPALVETIGGGEVNYNAGKVAGIEESSAAASAAINNSSGNDDVVNSLREQPDDEPTSLKSSSTAARQVSAIEDSDTNEVPLCTNYNTRTKPSAWQVVARLSWNALLPQLAIWPLFVAISLNEPTTGFEVSQIPWILHLVIGHCWIFYALPVILLNLIGLEDKSFLFSAAELVSTVVMICVAVLLPYAMNLNTELVPLFNWLVGCPIWVIGLFFGVVEWYYKISPSATNAAAGSVSESTRSENSSSLIVIAKITAFGTAFSAMALTLVSFLITFIWFAGNDQPLWKQMLLGSCLGTATLAVRVFVPFFIFKVVKVPLGKHMKFFLSFWGELAAELWMQLAFPQINDVKVFLIVAFFETMSIVTGSMWCFPKYQKWMTTGDVQGNPTSHRVLAKKIVHRVSSSGSILLQFKNKKEILHEPSNAQAESAYPLTPQWFHAARTHLFLRFWAELNATISFVCFLTMATFSHNGSFYPFALDLTTWARSVIFSIVVLFMQLGVLFIVIHVSSEGDSAKRALIDIFQQGYHFLSEPKFFWFTLIASVSLLHLVENIFPKQINGVFSFYDQ